MRPFRPARWLPGAHAHTVGARALRAGTELSYRRERIDTPDGDFLDLDHLAPDGRDRSDRRRAAVVILHGLEGCSTSGYVLEAARCLARRGVHAVALNLRSCSGEPNRLPGSYHAGRTDDLDFVLRRLEARWPGRPLGALGFSLGGNILLTYLGRSGNTARVSAAAAVSVPFDLALSAAAMERGAGRLYARGFLRSLKASATAKAARFPEAIDLRAAERAATVRAFDDAVTAPLHGFRDAAHYYRTCSSGGHLEGIRVPTLVLQALDDPLVPPDAVPAARLGAHPRVVAVLTSTGGHVGFVEGTPWRPRFWAEREAARYLAASLGTDGDA